MYTYININVIHACMHIHIYPWLPLGPAGRPQHRIRAAVEANLKGEDAEVVVTTCGAYLPTVGVQPRPPKYPKQWLIDFYFGR